MIESQKSNFERTILVGVINDSQNEEKLNEFLEELEFLSVTAGGEVFRKFKQKIKSPNPLPTSIILSSTSICVISEII